MKICEKCKAVLNDDAKFCPKCGCRQAEGMQGRPAVENGPADESITETGKKEKTGKNNRHRRNAAVWVVGIMIMAAAGIFCAFFLSGAVQKGRFVHHMELGERYLEEMKYEEAVLEFTAAVRIEPRKMEVYLSLADAYTGLGRDDGAGQVLETAFSVIRTEYEEKERGPEKSELVLERLMDSYEEQGRDEQADEVKQWIEIISPGQKRETDDGEGGDGNGNGKEGWDDTDGSGSDGSGPGKEESDRDGQNSDDQNSDDPGQSGTENSKPDVTEAELRSILETAADREILEFFYCDLNKDGRHEAVAATGTVDFDDYMASVELWFVDEAGAFTVETGIDELSFPMDFWYLEIGDVGTEQHVVLNGNMMMGSMKHCFTYRMENRGLQRVYDGYGEFFTRDGRLWYGSEDYDGAESDIGMLGHTWKDYPIFYEDGTYKEYGGTEITREFFMGYQNAAAVWDEMLSEVLENNSEAKYEAKIWYRGNGLITVDFGVYNSEGYRTFSHVYVELQNSQVRLLPWESTDETGRVIDSYCSKGGLLGESGTGFPVKYPEPLKR